MNGQAIIELFENLVDDSLDADFELQLANIARKKVEAKRPWSFLKKLDSSQSASSSGLTLPTDYMRTDRLVVGSTRLDQVPFEQAYLYTSASGYWYLDYANGVFYITGVSPSGAVKHYYIRKTPDLTLTTSPVWPDYHELIAYEMAEQFFAIDQGDRSRSWDDKHAMQKALLERAMVEWDVRLQADAVENGQYAEAGRQTDIANGIIV